VSIIRAGRREQSGTLDELRRLTRTSITAEVTRAANGLLDIQGIHGLEVAGTHLRFDVDTAHLDAAVRRLSELGIRNLVSHPPTLEELFLRQYGDELADDRSRTGPDGDG
jgi:ABC-2 type transport system ATP-binding protein